MAREKAPLLVHAAGCLVGKGHFERSQIGNRALAREADDDSQGKFGALRMGRLPNHAAEDQMQRGGW